MFAELHEKLRVTWSEGMRARLNAEWMAKKRREKLEEVESKPRLLRDESWGELEEVHKRKLEEKRERRRLQG